MKYCLLMLLLFCIRGVVSGRSSTEIVVSGKLVGEHKGRAYLFFEDHYRQKDSISSAVTNGRFRFTCKVQLPILAKLHLGQNSFICEFYIDGARTTLVCENKFCITNNTDTMNLLKITASEGSQMERLRHRYEQCFVQLNETGIDIKERQDWFNTIDTFSKSNPNNKLSPYLINRSASILSYDQLIKLYDNLAKKSLYGTMEMKALQHQLDVVQKEHLRQNGTPFHDVILSDTSGGLMDTRSLHANVFLLVCWASWCHPCREENSHLNELNEKYKDKGLKMIGISFDQDSTSWKKAIKADGLSWLQLIDRQGTQGELARYYGISAIPSIFILDQDKRIISSNLSDIEDLLEKRRIN